MKKYLVISALGKDHVGIVNELAKAILDAGGNIENSRMTVLGGEFAVILMVSGHWKALSELEGIVPNLEKNLNLTIIAKYTEERPTRQTTLPYMVDVISMDHPGIVRDVAEFFASREINIEDLNTWTYAAAHTGAPMFSLNMTVSVPAELNIGQLRQEFTDFCDDLNLDATLEPARH